MVQTSRRIFREPDRVCSFREELLRLYAAFKEDIEVLCKKYDVRVDYWYSPSAIPQPKFIIENAGFTADELYIEKELPILLNKRKKETGNPNRELFFEPFF